MDFFTIEQYKNEINKNGLEKTLNSLFAFLDTFIKTNNSFISLTKEIASKESKSNNHNLLLDGICYSLKDNICTKGHLTTGGSKILDNYIPDYDAEVYQKLKQAGAILVGKNNLDELGMEGTGLSTFYGKVVNPWNNKKISGGSSSGSAVAVALGIVPFSIGTDTGDSVRMPACYCGIHGFKPTWNRISKYGIIPYTPSLDTAGIFTNCVKDCAKIYEVISGPDKKDATCSHFPKDKVYTEKRYSSDVKGKKILIINEIYNKLKTKPEEYDAFNDCLNHLKNVGATIFYEDFGIDLLKNLLPTYNMISFAESTSCQSYLQGIIFGNSDKKNLSFKNWEDIIIETRRKFTITTKLRQIFGAYFLLEENREKYFERGKKMRRLISNKMSKIFEKYDIIITPAPSIAPSIKDILKLKSYSQQPYNLLSDHFLLANFYGCPSYSLPISLVDKMPYSILLTTDQFNEDKCLSFASEIEKYSQWDQKRKILLNSYEK